MRVGDKLLCIKEYIDYDTDYNVIFRKDQLYPIDEIYDNFIRITGEVKYHNNSGVIYLNHAFSIKKSKKHINGRSLYKYFINLKKIRKQKLEKLNEIDEEGNMYKYKAL